MVRGSGGERASRTAKQGRGYRRAVRDLGLQVRRLRQDRGWTLEQAAERMDVDLKHLQKIEAGQLNVQLVTIVRIAAGLDVPVAQLFAASR